MFATSADGTKIAYRRRGEGEPVLFVHGAATSSADWSLLAPHLPFEVISMDRRGRGRSEDGPEYAMEREAEDVLAVLEAAGAELLVAHSYGALCSILAVQRTDRVRRLVLYEPPIAYRGEGLDELETADDETILARFLKTAGTTGEQRELIRASPAWPVLMNAVPALPRELRAGTTWRNPAGPIAVPTLLLLGEDTRSPTYLDTVDELLAAFSDVERDTVPGQHVAHVFAAEAFAKRISSFLAQPVAEA